MFTKNINSYKKRALTLIELLISMTLISLSILALTAVSIYVFRQISLNIERANLHKQIDYSLDHIKLYLRSASRFIDYPYSPRGILRSHILFMGEQDPYSVTPDEISDDAAYLYIVEDTQGRISNKYLGFYEVDFSNPGNPEFIPLEMLVDTKYNPQLAVIWYAGDPPNLLTVKITGCLSGCTGENCCVAKEEAVRLWYVDVVG